MSHIRTLINKATNTSPYENLREILGKELGQAIYDIVNEADFMDKELDLVHKCITKLYDRDANVPEIKKTLAKIKKRK